MTANFHDVVRHREVREVKPGVLYLIYSRSAVVGLAEHRPADAKLYPGRLQFRVAQRSFGTWRVACEPTWGVNAAIALSALSDDVPVWATSPIAAAADADRWITWMRAVVESYQDDPRVETRVDGVYAAVARGDNDYAMDLLYDMLDPTAYVSGGLRTRSGDEDDVGEDEATLRARHERREFARVDGLCAFLDPDQLNAETLIAALIATLGFRTRLRHRSRLVEAARVALIAEGDDPSDGLRGLL